MKIFEVVSKKQKDADQAKGSDPMPKAKAGRKEHPLKGKLVGENTSASAVASLAAPVGNLIKRGKHGAPVAPQKKNKNGTVMNALDMPNNIMGHKTKKQ